jgi:hypothetical protein
MSDEVIPFRKPKVEQLTLDQVKELRQAGREDEIERARIGGHLEDVMAGKKPAPPENQ